jgi:hypothetical protein
LRRGKERKIRARLFFRIFKKRRKKAIWKDREKSAGAFGEKESKGEEFGGNGKN